MRTGILCSAAVGVVGQSVSSASTVQTPEGVDLAGRSSDRKIPASVAGVDGGTKRRSGIGGLGNCRSADMVEQ